MRPRRVTIVAGDWIKMRMNLAEDPAVIAIADILDASEDLIVGKLHRLWSWANGQTVDGNAVGVTEKWIDRYLSCAGFAAAMQKAGWLIVTVGGVEFPDFDRHNGQPAKQRALTARRVAAAKARKGNGVTVTGALPREEKRREEKRRKKIDGRLVSPTSKEDGIKAPQTDGDEAGRGDHETSWVSAVGLANEIARTLPIRPRSNADRSLLLKACWLIAHGPMPENWLRDSIEAWRHRKPPTSGKGTPWGFFTRCLQNKAESLGHNLNRLLAGVELPAGILEPAK